MKVRQRVRYAVIISIFLASFHSNLVLQADTQADAEMIATLTRFYGEVKLLKDPSPTSKSNGPQVLYRDQYFSVSKPKIGDQLLAGDVIQTGKVGRARLIYRSGDQISIDANTSFLMAKGGGAETEKKNTMVDLLFGNMRALIRKRNSEEAEMNVRTKSMVMGVRGTDFFVKATGSSEGGQITVIRGKVEVKLADQKPNTAPVVIPSGYSLVLADQQQARQKNEAPPEKSQANPFKLRRTNRGELAEIHKASRVNPPAPELLANSPNGVEIQKLEEEALSALKEDIKHYEPEVYQKIEKIPADKIQDSDLIQSISTRESYKKAPSSNRGEKANPQRRYDLDSYGEDVYEKYLNQ